MNRTPRVEAALLGMLFGVIYLVQGVADPSDGLIVQPVNAMLKRLDRSMSDVGIFTAVLAIPWALKPFLGLLTDFVPIGRWRRKSYLILASGVTTASMFGLYWFGVSARVELSLWMWLVPATLGVALADVVADALMIETGQPRGLTGQFQSIQWACLSAGMMIAGSLGGYLASLQLESVSFLICGLLCLGLFVLAVGVVREPPNPRIVETPIAPIVEAPGGPTMTLRQAIFSPTLLAVAAFLFLWNFNPFSEGVLYRHVTEHLRIDEATTGHGSALLALGYFLGSLSYGAYCRRVPMTILIHLSIVMGIITTVLCVSIEGARSLLAIRFLTGFAYMTGNLIQLDLVARTCPAAASGTIFAVLMAVSNVAVISSTAVGGIAYFDFALRWSPETAFLLLVVAGALYTAACWLLVPRLREQAAST